MDRGNGFILGVICALTAILGGLILDMNYDGCVHGLTGEPYCVEEHWEEHVDLMDWNREGFSMAMDMAVAAMG